MQKITAVSVVVLSLLLFFACNTVEQAAHIIEIPPSIIYADDENTELGHFSNVGKAGPNLAPYFCASLEADLNTLFAQKDAKGNFIYHKKDSSRYDIYSDELKIFTTINPEMQKHAEAAMRRHITEDLQPAFTENNSKSKISPYSETYNGKVVRAITISKILDRARKTSSRYQNMNSTGISDPEIFASFKVPVPMKIFSWEGEIDTVLTPNDSILYHKNFIQASVLSLEPRTGYVKAWVGGIDFDHFPNDNVRSQKRQMGSTIKPFLYATALSMGVIKPCTEFNDERYCVEPCDPGGRKWCPEGTLSGNVRTAFALSSSGIGSTPSIMSKMGACSGPLTLAKLLERVGIIVPDEQITPAMCLGTPDASLLNLVAAQSLFVNDGVYIAPQTILRIEDRHGNVIYSAKTSSKEVFNSIVSFEMLQLMKGLVEFGQSTSLRGSSKWGGIEHPTAASVGTTQSNTDAWYIGLTPDLVTGVWVGGEDKQIRFRSMTWGQGARAALPIYGYFMQKVYADSSLNISTKDFNPPKDYNPELFKCDEPHTPNPPNPFGV